MLANRSQVDILKPIAALVAVLGMLVAPEPGIGFHIFGIFLIIGGLSLLLMPKWVGLRLPVRQEIKHIYHPTVALGGRYYVSDDEYWIAEVAGFNELHLYRQGETSIYATTTIEEIERNLRLLSRSRRTSPQREQYKRMLSRCKNLLVDYQASVFFWLPRTFARAVNHQNKLEITRKWRRPFRNGGRSR
jgi:hypothetical protein